MALRELRPRCVLAHYWEDAHPDHVAASALTEAARFWAKLTKTDMPFEPFYPPRLLYFFSVHLRLHPKPSLVVDISAHLETKMRALACYHSQLVQGRPTTPPTFLDQLRDWLLSGMGDRDGVWRTAGEPGGDRLARTAGLSITVERKDPKAFQETASSSCTTIFLMSSERKICPNNFTNSVSFPAEAVLLRISESTSTGYCSNPCRACRNGYRKAN